MKSETSVQNIFASPGYYAIPELKQTYDLWWNKLSQILQEDGVVKIPIHLSTNFSESNQFIFQQICGIMLAKSKIEKYHYIATPVYNTPFFNGSRYVSLLVVHKNSKIRKLSDAKGLRVGVNGLDSHSGWNIICKILKKNNFDANNYFSEIKISGSHRESIQMILRNESDISSIDALTWTLIDQEKNNELHDCRILFKTPDELSPPWVLDGSLSKHIVQPMRKGLKRFFNDSSVKELNKRLCLTGFEILSRHAYKKSFLR
jgi:ABC-type phosphate/phosphonate transport system substrate-binding protein